jgi:hypothetical protein
MSDVRKSDLGAVTPRKAFEAHHLILNSADKAHIPDWPHRLEQPVHSRIHSDPNPILSSRASARMTSVVSRANFSGVLLHKIERCVLSSQRAEKGSLKLFDAQKENS